MLQPGLHIHDDHVVLPEDQVGEKPLEHDVLRADAAAAAGLDGAQHQQAHAVMLLGHHVRDVVHFGVYFKKLPVGIGPGAGALGDELAHFGDGGDACQLLLAEAQGGAQVGVRVHVGAEDLVALRGVEPGQDGGDGGLSYAALSRDCDLHGRFLPPQMPRAARLASMPSIIAFTSSSQSVLMI